MAKHVFISDVYREARGGWSRMLHISCKECGQFLFDYQKDGPGPLKRLYLDRLVDYVPTFNVNGFLFCPKCGLCIGFNEPYAKENNRPAMRLAAQGIQY